MQTCQDLPIDLFPQHSRSNVLEKFVTDLLSLGSDNKLKIIDHISTHLLRFVLESKNNSFCLPDMVSLINSVNDAKLLPKPYQFSLFEWWLINKSRLSLNDEMSVRSKIMGKSMSSFSYKDMLPMQGVSSPHVVTAHPSPDIDTSVTSFITWTDAFVLKMSPYLHIWNLPGGKLSDQDKFFFEAFIGKHCLSVLPTHYSEISSIAFYYSKPLPSLSINSTQSLRHIQTTTAITEDNGEFLCICSTEDIKFIEQVFECLINQSQRTAIISNAIKSIEDAHSNKSIDELISRNEIEEVVFSPYTLVKIKKKLFKQSIANIETKLCDATDMLKTQDIVPITMQTNEECIHIGYIDSNILTRCSPLTLSLRDFSDRQSMSIDEDVSIVSVVDHHKSNLKTSVPATVLIAPVEACSVLITEQLQRCNYEWINANRKNCDNILLIAAILDDTDLLSKAKTRDLMAMQMLLDDLSGTHTEATKESILGHPYCKAIYTKSIGIRENQINDAITRASIGSSFDIFYDTKKQVDKFVSYVCQVKLFPSNIETLSTNLAKIAQQWIKFCQQSQFSNKDMCVLMLSTIKGADECRHQTETPYRHFDQIWISSADTQLVYNLVASIEKSKLNNNLLRTELLTVQHGNINTKTVTLGPGQDTEITDPQTSFFSIVVKAGSMNSRKTDISPFLP